jgi:putative two-component system response regulator
MIRFAARLHDIGKIGIPDSILLKPGKLTSDEFAVMSTHTSIGARILAGGSSEVVTLAERIALSHHERWDGAGYPHRLEGASIPVEARIVAAADVLDALSHARPYRDAWPMSAVIAFIERGSGSHFDPTVVQALQQVVAEAGDGREILAVA